MFVPKALLRTKYAFKLALRCFYNVFRPVEETVRLAKVVSFVEIRNDLETKKRTRKVPKSSVTRLRS